MSKESQLLSEIREYRQKEGRMAFWWLGQLGFLVRLGDVTLMIDGKSYTFNAQGYWVP